MFLTTAITIFDDYKNAEICRKVANKCYLPTNRLMLELIRKYKGKFRISYSITGVLLEQLEKFHGRIDHVQAAG